MTSGDSISFGNTNSINRSKSRQCSVRVQTMDAELQFDIERLTKGSVLFDLVCRTVNLRETWFFGLQFIDSKSYVSWLKMDKKVFEQDVGREQPASFTLLAKFYPENVFEELIQEVTRHLFFLQVKQSILNMDIYCPPEAAVLLASYALQAKYGDYDEDNFQPGMIAPEDLLPQRVMDLYQMTPDMWAEKIKIWYADHIGMTRDEVELEYLKVAQDLQMYAVSYFTIKNKKKTDLWLGIHAHGLCMYDRENRLEPKVTFMWSEIKNISFRDKKFTVKPVDKKTTTFIFFSPNQRTSKMILELCMGNHELYIRRRQPDTMEVQQMKTQASEEKLRRQLERTRLAREKQLREEVQREKEELERRLLQTTEEFRQAQEALVRSEETAELLAEKARIAEEEIALLSQKAGEAEAERQRIKMSALKTENEKLLMERRAQEAELLATRIVEECERRTKETEQLKEDLLKARHTEKMARDQLIEFSRSYAESAYSGSVLPPYPQSYSYSSALPDNLADLSNMDELSLEIAREKKDDWEKSRILQERLRALQTEFEVLKVEDPEFEYDRLPEENRGLDYTVQKQPIKTGTTKSRVAFFEEL